MSTDRLVEHFFRHEYGRLVATLVRRVGVRHIEAVEDAAQTALMTALETWTTGGVPDQPSAWLFRVAHNALLGELRAQTRRERLAAQHALPQLAPSELQNDLLGMLFVCCDAAIPIESQLVLALKTLCGFDVREIAARLFLSEANVYKRLARARTRLRESPPGPAELTHEERRARLPALQAVLYVLFTEGYLSSDHEVPLRRELCEEAIRLATLLAEEPVGQTPETFALLALMHLHAARMSARADASGGLLLLEEQDRSRWNTHQIQEGLFWLAKSASGEQFSRYHAEAGIAAEHCLAASLEETRWDKIEECYALLEQLAPSPLHRLNRALAVAQQRGAAAGLAVLAGLEPPSWLAGSYAWAAVFADLHRRAGHRELAQRYRAIALESAPTPALKTLLQRRLGADG